MTEYVTRILDRKANFIVLLGCNRNIQTLTNKEQQTHGDYRKPNPW